MRRSPPTTILDRVIAQSCCNSSATLFVGDQNRQRPANDPMPSIAKPVHTSTPNRAKAPKTMRSILAVAFVVVGIFGASDCHGFDSVVLEHHESSQADHHEDRLRIELMGRTSDN